MAPDQKKHTFLKKFKLPLEIGLAVLLWLVALTVFCTLMDIQPTVFYSLQGHMSVDVTHENGEVEHFEDGDFGCVYYGDRLEIHVNMEDALAIKAAELFAPLYNIVLDVSIENQGVLYRDNVNMTDLKKHYGNRIYEVQLPGGYENKEIVMKITPMGRLPYSDFSGVGIIPANEGWKQIITGHTFVFMTMITLMIMALVCFCYFTLKSIEEHKLHIGLPIAIYELTACGWYFGSLSMFYLLIEDVSFCAKIEYYSLYMLPIAVTVFIHQVIKRKVMKKHVKVIGVLYTVFYVIVTVIERMPGMPNYSNMLPYMHIMTAITLVCLVMALFVEAKEDADPYIAILKVGILVAIFCGLSEMIRFNLVKYVFKNSWITTGGLSNVAILVVAICLVIYLIAYSTSEFAVQIERNQLMKLAYQDALTSMPNRADCYRNIEEMEKKKIQVYTMVFIDLNDLKKTNDNMGHDAGDQLLKITADEIVEFFSQNGFVSRWGGDEFVACVFEKEEKTIQKIEEFQEKIRKLDQEGGYPFRISVAIGYIESNEHNYLAPIEAIRQADERMYENKRRMKALQA